MSASTGGTILMLTREGMGHADPDLQKRLLQKYLTLVLEDDQIPWAICFYTEGVRLVVEGSSVLEQLQALQKRGVCLIACHTCLQAYGLLEQVRVGIVGGIRDILAAQNRAAKVISL